MHQVGFDKSQVVIGKSGLVDKVEFGSGWIWYVRLGLVGQVGFDRSGFACKIRVFSCDKQLKKW